MTTIKSMDEKTYRKHLLDNQIEKKQIDIICDRLYRGKK